MTGTLVDSGGALSTTNDIETATYPVPATTAPGWRPKRLLLTAAVAMVVLLCLTFLISWLGPAGVRHEDARCVSAQSVSCELSDGWTVAVPSDVSWADPAGTWHDSGRPDCLPPNRHGGEVQVGISWVQVTVNHRSWRQVVAVACP